MDRFIQYAKCSAGFGTSLFYWIQGWHLWVLGFALWVMRKNNLNLNAMSKAHRAVNVCTLNLWKKILKMCISALYKVRDDYTLFYDVCFVINHPFSRDLFHPTILQRFWHCRKSQWKFLLVVTKSRFLFIQNVVLLSFSMSESKLNLPSPGKKL